MYFSVSRISISGVVLFLRVGPVVLGYYHSAFAFLQVYFLIWYLEVLKRIRAIAVRELKNTGSRRPGGDSNLIRKKPRLERYFPDNDPDSELLSTLDHNDIVDLYNNVRQQVAEFGKLFGPWVSLDIGHSVLRIIFSGYFIASIMSRKNPNFSQIMQNFFTMVVYLYLLYMVARLGSELESESQDILFDLGKLEDFKNLNHCKVILMHRSKNNHVEE